MEASEPFILALVVAQTPGSAALCRGEEILKEIVFEDAPRGGSFLAPAVEELLRSAPEGRVDLVAVGLGPGSFTGARIGSTFAQFFAFARGVSILGVSDLEALASRLAETDGARASVVPGIVAHDGRVSTAAYAKDAAPRSILRSLAAAATVERAEYDALVALHGAELALAPPLRVLASDVARVAARRFARDGRGDDPATLEPHYLEPAAPERVKP